MKLRRAGILLLVIQLVLVLSVAAKYLYERKTSPRVWVRTAQYDPQLPIRGRYLAVRPAIDACGLPHEPAYYTKSYVMPHNGLRVPASWTWPISLVPENGVLKAHLEGGGLNSSLKRGSFADREGIYWIDVREDQPCDKVPVQEVMLYFLPEHAQLPMPLKSGQDLWIEVTVPPSGPSRPIQLALSDASGFKPLKFEHQ